MKTIDELINEEKLCKYCPYTDFGMEKVNTGPWNLCEGVYCKKAYEIYLEEEEY